MSLGTQGNLLCVTGGEGTGKSNYVAALIVGAIRSSGTDVDALSVTLHENSKNKAVLFYDMEQSEVQLYKNIINLLRRCRRESILEWFKAYYLTGMSGKSACFPLSRVWTNTIINMVASGSDRQNCGFDKMRQR